MAVPFVSDDVTFGSQCLLTHGHDTSVTVQGVTDEPSEPVHPVNDIIEPQIRHPRQCPGNIMMVNGD